MDFNLKVYILLTRTVNNLLLPVPLTGSPKARVVCYYVHVMHVKDPQLPVVRVEHRVPLAGFCLSLYSLHMLNRDVSIIQIQISHETYSHYREYVCICMAIKIQIYLQFKYFSRVEYFREY